MNEWINGDFNLCVPINLISDRITVYPQRVLIRFPLPYKIGESSYPGNSDEKLRCEIATYVWMKQNCPKIPTPRLWSFGWSNGHSLVAVENAPILTRWIHCSRTIWRSLLRRPLPSSYTSYPVPHDLQVGFLIIDFIEEDQGRMLSETWEEQKGDKDQRSNLFRGLSKIILSLSQHPLPRIGSFQIDNDGIVSLTNRPLTLELQELENEAIPVTIPRDNTYITTYSYLTDLLECHRNRLRYQPNGAMSTTDCMSQMCILVIMSAVMETFFPRGLHRGPFILTLTDLHISNIFVDSDWNITKLIDLEWACTRPLDMQHPPHWLTCHAVDQIDVELYDKLREEFMTIFEEEEMATTPTLPNFSQVPDRSILLSRLMREGWENGNFWYSLALDSMTGMHSLFYKHIQPRFDRSHEELSEFYQVVYRYWKPDAYEFIKRKMREKDDYDRDLEAAFALSACQPD
ncbi:hypothetical protein MMC25_002926 [Agyrium rufum]|nr:hypothetical protein [Agyrium rufum]